VNCREFQELISAAVDRYLNGRERELFDEHAAACGQCYRAYQDELDTKALVQQRLPMHATPPVVYRSILERLDREAPPPARRLWVSLYEFLSTPFVRPALVVMVAAAVVVTIVMRPVADSRIAVVSDRTDVVEQSLSNYQAAVGGGMVPDVVSNEPKALRGFFDGKTSFSVHVPVMKECTLLGGTVNDVRGTKVAHVLYQRSSRIIYMYQVCLETAMQGDKLSLTEPVRNELQRTGWFKQTTADGNALVLWKHGGALCAAVSSMNPNDLVECLKSEEADVPR
jgi:anti-sigma factor RsiW